MLHWLKIAIIILVFQHAYCGFSQSYLASGHDIWDDLLKRHVKTGGAVDYRSFKKDHSLLKKYLNILSENPPPESAGKDERLAYWINAYNAFTVDLILDHYPVESINDIGGWFQIPFVNSVFDKKFFKIGNEEMSLNNIENGILRKEFNEPRIHFAINCASVSCPALRPEAYEAGRLDGQLEEQTARFINDPSKNRIAREGVEISKIFSWFGGDFKKNGSVIDFINEYTAVEIDRNATIDYMDYNWDLNNTD